MEWYDIWGVWGMGGCRSLLVVFLFLAEVVHDVSDGFLNIVDTLACMREDLPI